MRTQWRAVISSIATAANAALALFPPQAGEKGCPTKSVKMVVGFAPGGGAPRECADYVRQEIAKYGKLVKQLNIKVE